MAKSTNARRRPAANRAAEVEPAVGTEGQSKDRARSIFQPGLSWRCIGPYRGGRVVAVSGDPANARTYYFGSTGGGVWKSTDGGLYWRNVSDGYFQRASVGALAVAPADPNVIYAGMGEATIRGNVSHGDGVYTSSDGGKTWRHLGLAATRNIAKVRVHPSDPDVVYVAALGHAHGPNRERGVFRSRDGGETWEQVLFTSEDVGACDLALDPRNPRMLYAACWRARRLPHQLVSGGAGCALFRSTDGGSTWTELTRKKGLPGAPVGKIGVAVSPARSGRVWAIVEAREGDGGIYRSDDDGETWEKLCTDRGIQQRPWYYQHLVADPRNPEVVWVLNVRLWRSSDGGRSFSRMPAPHGDHHDLWIAPDDPRRMIEGNDGGAMVTGNGGESWSSLYNQPTAELYHVTADEQVPYRVYGAQQDNTTISVPSRSAHPAILSSDSLEVGGGESGYIAVRPDDPNIIYAGSYQGYLTRFDLRTNQSRDISVWPEAGIGWPARDVRYRFQWTFPIALSPHDPRVLYTAGNRLFRSTDEGASWEAISPDLTRHDETRLGDSGGEITRDNCGTEYYATIFAFAESPLRRGLLWAGSDDGLVHLSRDGGGTWEPVTPPDLPEWALVSVIEPSPHDPGAAYLAATRYKLDDFAPYLFKTSDYGRTWTRITTGLPDDVFTRVIREDPVRRGLLYTGTETGVCVSFDDGARWQPLQLDLPVVPVHDLVVKGSDLVAATHGRSFWILDDLTPLHTFGEEIRAAAAHLFAPRPVIRFAGESTGGTPVPGLVNYSRAGAWVFAYDQVTKPDGEQEPRPLDAGRNPHDGVYVTYYLKERPEDELTLTFLDAEGGEIISYASTERKEPIAIAGDARLRTEPPKRERTATKAPKEAGFNRFYWDMRTPAAHPINGYVTRSGVVAGPVVPPGTYQVRLTIGGQALTQPLTIHADPRGSASQADLEAQFALLRQICDKLSQTHDAIETAQGLRRQVEEWERRAQSQPEAGELRRAGTALKERLSAVEGELMQPAATEDDDTLRYPVKLNVKLAALYDSVASADAAPTRQAQEVYAALAERVDAQCARLAELIERDVAQFNGLARDLRIPALAPTSGPRLN